MAPFTSLSSSNANGVPCEALEHGLFRRTFDRPDSSSHITCAASSCEPPHPP